MVFRRPDGRRNDSALRRAFQFRRPAGRRNPLALRRAVAPNLRAVSRACVPKYAAPAISRESSAPQPFSLTYYANQEHLAPSLAPTRFSLAYYANQEHFAPSPLAYQPAERSSTANGFGCFADGALSSAFSRWHWIGLCSCRRWWKCRRQSRCSSIATCRFLWRNRACCHRIRPTRCGSI